MYVLLSLRYRYTSWLDSTFDVYGIMLGCFCGFISVFFLWRGVVDISNDARLFL